MAKYTLIKCGKLFDGLKEELQENKQILIEGNTIKEVGENLAFPEGTEIIDLSHLTVTPGMIDAHVHSDLMTTGAKTGTINNASFESDSYHTLAHLHTAQRELKRGFTSIRCMSLNNHDYGVVDAKKAIEAGYFPGARMVVACHMLGSIGGHADYSTMFGMRGNPALSASYVNPTCVGAGPDFFRAAVQNECKFGSDYIKIMLSGGFFTPNDAPEDQQLNDDELRAIIDTAHGCHRTVTAHVYAPYLLNKLLDFGLDGCEHAALIDEPTARRFEQSSAYVVPTFVPYNEIIWMDEAKLKLKGPAMERKLRQYQKQLTESREIIVNSNMKLGYGTDIVSVYECYDSWVEYESWMKAGMSPFRTLKAATSVNAEILEIDSYTGSIVPGKRADIAAWHRDLLTDPKALKECDFVMKDGIVYQPEYA